MKQLREKLTGRTAALVAVILEVMGAMIVQNIVMTQARAEHGTCDRPQGKSFPSQLIQEIQKQKCMEIFTKGKAKKFGRYYEDGDRPDELNFTPLIQEFMKRKSVVKGAKIQGTSLPKMLAFGENHIADKGNKKRGRILTLIALEACLRGRSLTFMSEALHSEKIASISSSLRAKRDYLKDHLLMALIDQLPDSFVEGIRFETWEDKAASDAKLGIKSTAERIKQDVIQLLEVKNQVDDNDWYRKLVEGYRRAVNDLQFLEGALQHFVFRHAMGRDAALVRNTIKELEKDVDQTVVVIAGENHLNYENPYLDRLLERKDTSVIMLHSRDELGERLKKKTDLWGVLGDVEEGLESIKSRIRTVDRGVYLPAIPASISVRNR